MNSNPLRAAPGVQLLGSVHHEKGLAMMTTTNERELPEDRRQEIFRELVDAQDHDMSVAQSRKHVAERFEVSEQQVRQIEREGLDQSWPPLS
jgi:hypothetical protein